MNTTFKNTTAAVLAVATIATAGTFATVDTAEAGKNHWKWAAGGFVAGVIVNETARRHRYYEPHYVAPRHTAWDAHVSWCYDRWRTYSHHDNRYTKRPGLRVICHSPYL